MPKVKDISKSVTPRKEQKVLESRKSPDIPDYIWEEAKEEIHVVKGRFRLYGENQSGKTHSVAFRKYPPQICPMFNKTLRDGEVYEIPLYAARFINGFDKSAKKLNGNIHSCAYAKHGFKMSGASDLKPSNEGMTESGGGIPVPVAAIASYEQKMGFESLEFDAKIG